MSEFNNSKWNATNWTVEQKTRWQEKCFELGYKWCCGSTMVQDLTSRYFYVEVEGDIAFGNDTENFNRYSEVEKQYEDMFPVEEIVYLSPEGFAGRLIIATLGEKGAEEYLNGEGMTLNLPIKPEITQLLNQVFCTQVDEVETLTPETTTYFKRTDYELQIGDGLCLADLTEEQKALLAENFDMYDGETLSWCDGYIQYADNYVKDGTCFVGCTHDHPKLKKQIIFDTLFNKVPVEAVKDDEPEHIDTGFDGLVYVQPIVNSYIKPETLSAEQLEWFKVNVPFDEDMLSRDNYLCYCAEHDQDWYFSDSTDGDALTTFNEVFKESE